MPIGEARPWCELDKDCVLEDGHGGSVCEVVPGARELSRQREHEAEKAGVSRTGRDASGRALLHQEDTRPAADHIVRGKAVKHDG